MSTNGGKDAAALYLRELGHQRCGIEVLPEIETALRRYPNCFEVVYYAAQILRVVGLVHGDRSCSRKALGLYRRALELIGENRNPEISKISICRDMAGVHIALGEHRQGIELLKNNDPCRLNYSLIGQTLASYCDDPEGALPYLSMALLDLSVTQMQVVVGYLNVFFKRKQYEQALAMTDWALAFYPGLKKAGEPSYLDKTEAVLRAVRGEVLLRLGRKEHAAESLLRAKQLAESFDAAPDYRVGGVRFVSEDTEAASFDDLGDTAMNGVENLVADFRDPELLELWDAVKIGEI